MEAVANLLKVDFKRVLKDKLFLVMCILALVFSTINPLLMGGIQSIMDDESLQMVEAAGMTLTGQGQFFDAFTFGNNLGIIAPVLIAIILCKDFSAGTIRNKIISGYQRSRIFLSMYIVCLAVLFGVMLIHGLLTLAISLIFFPFQSSPVTLSSFGYFMGSLGLEFLMYMLIAALVCWLCALRKNVGLVIVLYVAIVMVMTLLAGILVGVKEVMVFIGGNDTAVKVIDFFQSINVFYSETYIGQGTGYETKELLSCILTPLVGTGAVLLWSILKFNKKDLK